MDIGAIEGATRNLGKPKDWDDATQGKCHCLPVRDMVDNEGGPVMVSAWIPSADDLVRLNNGESIKLMILGDSHPVVSVFVGEP